MKNQFAADRTRTPETKTLTGASATDRASETLNQRFQSLMNDENSSAPSFESITAQAQKPANAADALRVQVRATRQEDEAANFARSEVSEDETVLTLGANSAMPTNRPIWQRAVTWGGTALTVLWTVYSVHYAFTAYGLARVVAMGPQQAGILIASIMAPVALLWMVISQMQRNADIQRYAEALRSELQSIIFPSEDRAQRVSKDIERLCQQAAEMAAASRTVIKAIGRARQGLRTEIRDFVGVSKKTEFHIDRLAEALHEKSATLVSVADEIEKRTNGIVDRVKSGIVSMDQSAQSALTQADQIEKIMDNGVTRIAQAVARADETSGAIEQRMSGSFEGLQSAVDSVASRLQALSGEFTDHRKNLSDVAEQVSIEAQKLSESVKGQIDTLEKSTTCTLEVIERTGLVIEDKRKALDSGAERMAVHAARITETIDGSLANIGEAADSLTARTNQLESRLATQTEKLRETARALTGEASQIEEIGVAAANKLSEAMGVALSGAESIGDAVRRAIESLEKSTTAARDQAHDLIESTQTHVASLNEAGEGNVAHIKEIVTLLERSREQIEIASRMADQQVQKLSVAIDEQSTRITTSAASMSESVESVKISLAKPLRDMASAVAEADDRHQQIEETLRRRVADLNESSDKAKDSAEHIRTILRGQAQEISSMAGQIAAHARSINEQMGTQNALLGDTVSDSLANITKVREALEEQSRRLTGVADSAVHNIESLENRIAKRCEEMDEATSKTVSDLRSLDEDMEAKTVRLVSRSEIATKSISTIMNSLEVTASNFEPLFTNAMDKAGQTQDRFVELSRGFDASTASSLDRLQQVGIVFDQRLQDLQKGSDQASGLLRESSKELQQRVEDIERAALSSSNKMREIQSSLEDQSSDIHLLTDQALLKIETIQKAINEQFHELSESVGQALVRISDVGNELSRSSTRVDDAANNAVSRLEQAGNRAVSHAETMNAAGERTAELTENLVASVKQEAETLLNASRDTLLEIKRMGDSFALRTREVAEHMNAALKTSQKYHEELRDQADQVADKSVESADRISKAASSLTVQIDGIGSAAEDVISKIGVSRENLAQESTKFIDVSGSAIKAAEEASVSFSRHSNVLFKAVEDAIAHVDKIRKEEGRVQREVFMTSAKFIVESLHSLSVDFTRILEGEVPEKTWRAFQKGDVSAFTRRLAQLGAEMPVERIREKFASDNEFRTYVQRFLRQFDELFEQAVVVDYSDMLASTFISSDVGRLYTTLCTAAGREPKVKREDRAQAA